MRKPSLLIMTLALSACVAVTASKHSFMETEEEKEERIRSSVYLTRVDLLGMTSEEVLASLGKYPTKSIEHALRVVRLDERSKIESGDRAKTAIIAMYGKLNVGEAVELYYNGVQVSRYQITDGIPSKPLVIVEDLARWAGGEGTLRIAVGPREVFSEEIGVLGVVEK